MADLQPQTGPRVILYETFLKSHKVESIAESLGLPSPACAAGCCALVYLFYEKRSSDNRLRGPLGYLKRSLDAEAGVPGFVDAMAGVGLVRLESNYIEFVNYTETVGTTYKAFSLERKDRGSAGGKAKKIAQQERPLRPEQSVAAATSNCSSTHLISSHLISSGPEHAGEGATIDPHFQTKAFGDFWNAYPAHRRNPRVAVWRAWCGVFPLGEDANPDLPARIMASLDAHKRSAEWAREGGRFVPAAARWLEEGRFESEPPASPDDRPARTAEDVRRERERFLSPPDPEADHADDE